MQPLYLSELDVRELLDMETALEVVEQAFRELAHGRAQNIPRSRAQAPGIILHTMSASAEYLGLVGWKAYTTTPQGARFQVALYAVETGNLVALIDADYLGQLRTGAASGVATEFMARPDAKLVGLFGAGKQARTQLKAVCTVRNIERVEVYSRNEDRCRVFVEEMSQYCDTKVVPVRIPDAVAAEKDIVICATTSRTPLFDGRVLDEGTHLNVVGSNYLNKAEVDVATIRRADAIICDSVEQCRLEAGDFVQALEEGVVDWSLLRELSAVVAGQETGRPNGESITLFKSVGLAIEDVALAGRLWTLARETGLGQPLSLNADRLPF